MSMNCWCCEESWGSHLFSEQTFIAKLKRFAALRIWSVEVSWEFDKVHTPLHTFDWPGHHGEASRKVPLPSTERFVRTGWLWQQIVSFLSFQCSHVWGVLFLLPRQSIGAVGVLGWLLRNLWSVLGKQSNWFLANTLWCWFWCPWDFRDFRPLRKEIARMASFHCFLPSYLLDLCFPWSFLLF